MAKDKQIVILGISLAFIAIILIQLYNMNILEGNWDEVAIIYLSVFAFLFIIGLAFIMLRK